MAIILIIFNKMSAHFAAIHTMVLAVVFIIFTYMLSSIRLSILNNFIFFSEKAHHFCLLLLPENPSTQPTLQALVCGQNFSSFEDSRLYTSAGLIHLFVVSGSHLILMEKFINWVLTALNFKFPTSTKLVLLFLYCLVCQLNPPVVRSFLHMFLVVVLAHQHKHWPKDFTLLLTGLLCLLLQPHWITSLGLQMSWLAALAIQVNERFFTNASKLRHQVTFYLIFVFSFSCLGFPQVTAILTCLIFSSILEFVLLPLAFLIVPFPFLDVLFEKILDLLNFSLSHMELSLSQIQTDIDLTLSINWFIILALHVRLHFRKLKT